jgi:hypothetical protein
MNSLYIHGQHKGFLKNELATDWVCAQTSVSSQACTARHQIIQSGLV